MTNMTRRNFLKSAGVMTLLWQQRVFSLAAIAAKTL